MEKVVKKGKISDFGNADLKFWLSRPVEERISAVQTLREAFYGHSAGIQRIVKVIHRTQG